MPIKQEVINAIVNYNNELRNSLNERKFQANTPSTVSFPNNQHPARITPDISVHNYGGNKALKSIFNVKINQQEINDCINTWGRILAERNFRFIIFIVVPEGLKRNALDYAHTNRINLPRTAILPYRIENGQVNLLWDDQIVFNPSPSNDNNKKTTSSVAFFY